MDRPEPRWWRKALFGAFGLWPFFLMLAALAALPVIEDRVPRLVAGALYFSVWLAGLGGQILWGRHIDKGLTNQVLDRLGLRRGPNGLYGWTLQQLRHAQERNRQRLIENADRLDRESGEP